MGATLVVGVKGHTQGRTDRSPPERPRGNHGACLHGAEQTVGRYRVPGLSRVRPFPLALRNRITRSAYRVRDRTWLDVTRRRALRLINGIPLYLIPHLHQDA